MMRPQLAFIASAASARPGPLVEQNDTQHNFFHLNEKATEDYISGRSAEQA